MINEINKVIEEFEKLGYSHEEAVNIVESATTLSDEEIKRIADEFSRIGCTSFKLSPEEIKVIMNKCKKRYKEDIRDECCSCIWFDNNTGKRHCTANQNI